MSSDQLQRPLSYFIRLNSNPDLVLAEVNGRVDLAWRDVARYEQHWMLQQSSKTKNLYQLKNLVTSRTLNCSGYGDGVTFGDTNNWWDLAGSSAIDSSIVIRPSTNSDWNLNVLGNGPYDGGRRVGVWAWERGAANEVWRITETPQNPVMDHWMSLWNQSRGGYGHYLAVQANDMTGSLPLICDTNTPFPFTDIRAAFAKIDWGFGFALKSKYNGKYLYWSGPNQALAQSSTMSLRTLWTLGESPSYRALRPYLNSDQNLNVLGDPENNLGATVGTWDWTGGRDNEVWNFGEAYPPSKTST